MPVNSNYLIWLREADLHLISSLTDEQSPRETGGILMGYWGNSQEVVISQVVGPGPKAIHLPNSFIPDQEFDENEIRRIYIQSNRTETYLGDWHSHPDNESYLSGKDKATLRKIADFKKARVHKPIMLVLGTRPFKLNGWLHEYVGVFKVNSSVVKCRIQTYLSR